MKTRSRKAQGSKDTAKAEQRHTVDKFPQPQGWSLRWDGQSLSEAGRKRKK